MTVIEQVSEPLEADLRRTSRELFEQLQREQPGIYPAEWVHALQRRTKERRGEVALALPFASGTALKGPAMVQR